MCRAAPHGSGADSDTLAASVALSVTKTDGSATYTPGGTAAYTIVVTNAGPTNAGSVTVTDNFPAGVTLAAAATCVPTGAATCGSVVGATGASAFGTTAATIAAGAGNQLTFIAPVKFAAGMTTNPLINTATASDPAAGVPVSASDSDTLAASASADVGVVKTGPATIKAGAAITYTLLITNAGPSPANGATFMDNVPAAVTGVAASCGSAAGGAGSPAPSTSRGIRSAAPCRPCPSAAAWSSRSRGPSPASQRSRTRRRCPRRPEPPIRIRPTARSFGDHRRRICVEPDPGRLVVGAGAARRADVTRRNGPRG